MENLLKSFQENSDFLSLQPSDENGQSSSVFEEDSDQIVNIDEILQSKQLISLSLRITANFNIFPIIQEDIRIDQNALLNNLTVWKYPPNLVSYQTKFLNKERTLVVSDKSIEEDISFINTKRIIHKWSNILQRTFNKFLTNELNLFYLTKEPSPTKSQHSIDFNPQIIFYKPNKAFFDQEEHFCIFYGASVSQFSKISRFGTNIYILRDKKINPITKNTSEAGLHSSRFQGTTFIAFGKPTLRIILHVLSEELFSSNSPDSSKLTRHLPFIISDSFLMEFTPNPLELIPIASPKTYVDSESTQSSDSGLYKMKIVGIITPTIMKSLIKSLNNFKFPASKIKHSGYSILHPWNKPKESKRTPITIDKKLISGNPLNLLNPMVISVAFNQNKLNSKSTLEMNNLENSENKEDKKTPFYSFKIENFSKEIKSFPLDCTLELSQDKLTINCVSKFLKEIYWDQDIESSLNEFKNSSLSDSSKFHLIDEEITQFSLEKYVFIEV